MPRTEVMSVFFEIHIKYKVLFCGRHVITFSFLARSQNYEKRLLAPSYLSVLPSAVRIEHLGSH
jgi:hypothetical protein